MRPGCLGLILSVALLIGGGQGFYTALKNRQPVTMTVKDYLAHRPSGEWVHLKDAHCDLAECAVSGYAGTIQELFIPVRVPGENPESKVNVLLKTKDAQMVAAMVSLKAAAKDPAAQAKVIANNYKVLSGPKEISGLVEFGINADDKKRANLAGLHMNLASDFVIIADGEQPSTVGSLCMLAGGAFIGLLTLRGGAGAKGAPGGPAAMPPPNLPPRDFGGVPPPLPPK